MFFFFNIINKTKIILISNYNNNNKIKKIILIFIFIFLEEFFVEFGSEQIKSPLLFSFP
jgi:hypothetical protein